MPKRTGEECELMQTLSHALRAHQFVFVFRLHTFTDSPIPLTHKPLRVKAFLPKRFTFGTELHGCCPACCEKEIVHKTMESTKVKERVKEKDKSLHP